jgi:histone-arginine methyltransferase CARM1
LLPEPLAANKGEKIVGSLLFKVRPSSDASTNIADAQVNDARSYDITLHLTIDRPGPSHNPNPLDRTATYNLAQQVFK